MNNSLSGKVILITDSGTPIGRAASSLLTSRGAIVADGSPESTDYADPDAVRELLERIAAKHGAVDGLFYNLVPAPVVRPVAALTEEDLNTLIDRDISAAFVTAQTYGEWCHAREDAAGHVRSFTGSAMCFLGSIHDEKPNGAAPLYSFYMGALQNMVRECALYYGQWGVRTNLLEAGAMGGEDVLFESPVTNFYQGYAYKIPDGHVGTPEDIAEIAAFLLSGASRYVNGIGLRADGALTLHYMDAAANIREYRRREAEGLPEAETKPLSFASVIGDPDRRQAVLPGAMYLRGKNVLVTGSGKGIGSDIVLRAAEQGANVVVHYNSSEANARQVYARVQAVTESTGARCTLIRGDLLSDGGAEALFRAAEDFFAGRTGTDGTPVPAPASAAAEANSRPGIDILVNNAAMQLNLPFDRYDVTRLRRILRVNLRGYTMMSRLALPHMCAQNWGRIVNISSVHSKRPTTFDPGYAMTKGGIRMLTRELALEMVPYEITVNAIEPGAVEIGEKSGNPPSTITAKELAYPPLFAYKRLANGLLDPSEISAAVLFFISDAAARINGSCLRIDNGSMLK